MNFAYVRTRMLVYCTFAYARAHTHTLCEHNHTHTHMLMIHVHTCAHTFVRTYSHISTDGSTHAHIYSALYTFTNMYMHVFTHARVHIHTYIYVRIHTHKHVKIDSRVCLDGTRHMHNHMFGPMVFTSVRECLLVSSCIFWSYTLSAYVLAIRW